MWVSCEVLRFMKFFKLSVVDIVHMRGKIKHFSVFTALYILAFIVYDFLYGKRGNLEFILNAVVLFVLLNAGIYIHKKVQLPELVIIGISLFGLLHILGGTVIFQDGRLYEKTFLQGFIRYDNIVHLAGSFLSTIILFILFFSNNKNTNYLLMYFGVLLMALGTGVVNEIIEFSGVVLFHIEHKVGDYYNNSLDLVFNSIGSLFAIVFIDYVLFLKDGTKNYFQHLKKHFIK